MVVPFTHADVSTSRRLTLTDKTEWNQATEEWTCVSFIRFPRLLGKLGISIDVWICSSDSDLMWLMGSHKKGEKTQPLIWKSAWEFCMPLVSKDVLILSDSRRSRYMSLWQMVLFTRVKLFLLGKWWHKNIHGSDTFKNIIYTIHRRPGWYSNSLNVVL